MKFCRAKKEGLLSQPRNLMRALNDAFFHFAVTIGTVHGFTSCHVLVDGGNEYKDDVSHADARKRRVFRYDVLFFGFDRLDKQSREHDARNNGQKLKEKFHILILLVM